MASHDDLLQQGIAAARAGQQDLARQLLAQAIKLNPASEGAWIWMSSVVATNEQRAHCLQQVLAINPANELALRGLRALGALAQPEPPPPPPPAEPAYQEFAQAEPPQPVAYPYAAPPQAPPAHAPARPVPPAPDGVPLVDVAQVTAAEREVELILHQLRDQSTAPVTQIRWAAPENLQVRSRSPLSAFIPYAAVAGIGLVVVVLVVIFATTMFGLITGRQSGGQVAGVRPTTAATPTRRPPRTPTPQGTLYVSGPTNAPGSAPRGDLRFGKPTGTPPYINTPHPSSPPMNAALKAFNAGYFPDALDSIAKARENGDDSLDGYFVEGMSLARTFEYQQAIAAFNDGLAKDDRFAPLHAGLAYAYLQTNKFEQSRAEALKAIELDEHLVMSYVILSQVQMADGDYPAALKTIDDARTKNNKYDVNLIVAEGNIYLAQSDFNSATADGNLAYYIDPTAEGAVLLLARGQIGLKLNNSATVILENYIDNVNPGSAASWSLLAKLYTQAGRLIDGLEANNRAIQLSSNQSDALASRGLLYLEQGKLDLGCADLDDALKSDSQNYDARLGRAQCSYALGKYDAAMTDVEFLRGVTPNNPIVQTLYVQVLVKKQKYNDAISAASIALKGGQLSRDQLGYVYESWGYALYELGNYSEAAANIEAALTIADTGTRHYYKGLILEGLRDYPRASREYEWVLFWDRIYSYPFTRDATTHLKTVYSYLGQSTATPTPTASPSPTITPTRTPSPTPTKGATPTPTAGKTATPTPTPGKTGTPSKTGTPTPKATSTPGKTGTPGG